MNVDPIHRGLVDPNKTAIQSQINAIENPSKFDTYGTGSGLGGKLHNGFLGMERPQGDPMYRGGNIL